VLAGQGAMSAATALMGAHVLSRLAPLFLIRRLPYVGDEGAASKSKPLADAIGGGALLVGTLYALPAVLLLLFTQPPVQAMAALVACALAASYMAWLLVRRLQGFTGDGLGATQQLCELAIYLALAWQS
jgi:adenosylcobinamide-GDP ribazoletransferase